MAVAEENAPTPDLADLYRRYSRWLRARVRRDGFAEADDVVQETYLRLAQKSLPKDIHHPQALLLSMAQNIMRNTARRARTSKRTPGPSSHVARPGDMAADQFEAVFWTETVMAMPEPLRDTFLMSRVQGMSNEQIAKACNLSVKTVEWRLAKALAFCAARMRD